MASVPIGRVAISHQALPSIIPVNFVMVDRCVYFAAMSSSILAAATKQAVVAFQTDAYDTDRQSGWTVVGIGPVSWLGEAGELRNQLPIPWATGHRPDHCVKVELVHVSGHEINPDSPSTGSL
jgi:uncharacterized protein